MADIRDPLVKYNPLVLPATIVGTLYHADWRSARRNGLTGIVGEVASSALGTNAEPFFVPEKSDWQASDLEALLSKYGIKMWGVGCFNGQLFFRVKKRQAHWAQYVMLRAGVPLLHGLLPGTRANPQPQSEGASSQAARDAAPSGALTGFERFIDRLLEWLG